MPGDAQADRAIVMRCMSLSQPWAGLVASGVKLVENRPRKIVKIDDFGTPFAIHASREIVEDTYRRIAEVAPELPVGSGEWHRLSRITSAVIGVATIDRELHGWRGADILAYESELRAKLGDQFRWFFGPVGYVLRDVVALPTPVKCKGALGFWTLPDDIERQVRAQLPRGDP